MAPKKNARDPTAASAATSSASAATSGPTKLKQPSPSSPRGGAATWDQVLANFYQYYSRETPKRTKLIDGFLAYLVGVGALQFLYCVLAGNYPFNAFLSGFVATVGQFVLTVSLRMQTSRANEQDFPAVSQERAFTDFIICTLILHFFCVNFIN